MEKTNERGELIMEKITAYKRAGKFGMNTLKDKYVKRLADACKDGFRCCLIDKEDELEVQKLFFNDEHYYFTEQDDELWLNWE